jgi:hypothetical protein
MPKPTSKLAGLLPLNRLSKGRSTCARAAGAILLAQPAHLASAVNLIFSLVNAITPLLMVNSELSIVNCELIIGY